MVISNDQYQTLMTGRTTVVGTGGEKLGTLGDIYFGDQSGTPQWATVNTGLFGTSHSFVPLDRATVAGDDLQVPYDKELVKGAPRVEADGHLSPTEEDELYRYYGLSDGYAAPAAGIGTADATAGTGTTDAAGTTGYDTSGPTTDTAMTRSEEQLNVGTASREAGRARLRKYVVTEQQTVSVPVSHEEVRIEREPITDANVGAATDGPTISEEEHEVVLHEEVPVVSKEARPVERVRLDTETVTEQEQVTEDVRKEQIEFEGGEEPRTR
ncbi:uncharacterized protein (TIGR02271 family) [Georgenia soli]|uniref:Uncharacterized protein (TIGR02271 family) n=1 Tax=Georgenia soli TaxID=638953 RepID=A0A2A9EK07_9MICO|nr:PRC and DUF2382 domain-containing protein [Georgenia soli]PFG38946.1 uncharacterized protein (TIGR02271 family) [Georgenia soli]